MKNRIMVPKEHLSDYLLEGMREERYELYQLPDQSDDKKIVTGAVFTQTHEDQEGYSNPLGTHLTHISAMNLVSQSIIAHYCRKHGRTKHELGEFIGKDFSVCMKRPIVLTAPVRCVIDIVRERDTPRRAYGRYEYSLNEDSFTGTITAIIPGPKQSDR